MNTEFKTDQTILFFVPDKFRKEIDGEYQLPQNFELVKIIGPNNDKSGSFYLEGYTKSFKGNPQSFHANFFFPRHRLFADAICFKITNQIRKENEQRDC